MYAGFKNKKGLTGGDVKKGSGVHREDVWQWNWNEKLRDLGIKEANWQTVKNAAMSATGIEGSENAKDIIDNASGYYFRPTNGKGGDIRRN